jgi:peroxiredoxin family protein
MDQTGKEPPEENLTILVLSGEMEKGLAACNLALAGAASGGRVTLFFSFWGLNLLKRRNAAIRGPLLTRVLGRLNRDDVDRQRLGRFNMWGLGRRALLRVMRRKGMASFHESLTAAHELNVRIIACSTTIELMGLNREALIPEVDEIAGAMTFLGDSASGRSLCIS